MEVEFRELETWSSMNALLVIAMVEEMYDVNVTGEELQACKTVEDIFNKVLEKSPLGGSQN